MESLMVLIPLSVIIVAVAIGALIWAVNNGQYDQPDRDAERALAEPPSTTAKRRPQNESHSRSNPCIP